MKFLLIFALLFSGCGLYYNSYKPDFLLERKINQSRKSQIIKNGKTELVAVATYLNNVEPDIYNGDREYFYIEIFSELDIPLLEYMHFSLSGKAINNVIESSDFTSSVIKNSDATFLWIREIKKDENDKVLSLENKWSRGYLIAFDGLDYLQKKHMILSLDIDNVGSMKFNFAYKTLKSRL